MRIRWYWECTLLVDDQSFVARSVSNGMETRMFDSLQMYDFEV